MRYPLPICIALLAASACRKEGVSPSTVAPVPSPAAPAAKPAVEVVVNGAVAKGGRFVISGDTSINAALAMAGGWNGKGGLSPDDGHPPKYCYLYQAGARSTEARKKVPIAVNKETRTITVIDAEWSAYQLREGDVLTMPTVIF